MFSFKKIASYVWPHLMKYGWAFLTVFIFYGIRVLLDSVFKPLYFKKIVDLISQTVSDRAILSPSLMHLVFILMGISLAGAIISRFAKFSMIYFENKVLKELRDFTFVKVIQNSYTFFQNHFSGSLVTKSKRFVSSFETMFDIIVYNFWMTSVLLVGTFFVLYRQAPTLVFMFAIWICIYAVIIAVFINKKIKYDLLEAAADSRVGGRLSDVFSNILTTKIFSARESEVISFQEVTNDEAKKRWKSWSMGAIQDSIQSALNFVLQAGVLLVLVKLWIQGSITVGTVVLVQTYTGIILDRLWDLGNAMTRFMKSATDMKEMIDIFEEIPDVSDPHQPGTSKMKSGEIEFKNVHFNYIKEQNVFENFNLFIPRGQRIGLVGHSGSGKTTITKLLFRFSEVSDGEILIDGQDIRSVTQDDLRRAISYVPQEPILFHRTIRENIAYGKPDATDAEIIEAAKSAHAHEFISRLVHGYDTFVGERGVKLSGGERQRVAIARAMLKPAPILILDEATSSLDSVSESYIQEALEKLMQGKTVIVIAHRLSTIQKMDRIIVLENGKIAEDGNHKELLWLGGVYAELWDHQSGGFIQ